MRFLREVHTMPDGALSNLANLEELWLLRCQIDALSSDSLKGLANLRILDLRLNVLENITAGAFEHTPKLKDLKLLANYLTFDGETFRGLGELEVWLELLKVFLELICMTFAFFSLHFVWPCIESLLCFINNSTVDGLS